MSDKTAVIFGLEGLVLKHEERAFFKEANPLGYILFGRNVDNPDQLRALTSSLRDISGNLDTPILIDQEGGRVQRLRPPHWRSAPAAKVFGDLWDKSPDDANRAVELNTLLQAAELLDVGIDVDCAPLLDVPIPEVTDAIGNRAFHANPAVIIELARTQANTFLNAGVLPVIKHIPGHGRATSDSHMELPTVIEDAATLEKSDFVPFRALNDYPIGMTAHIVYQAYDDKLPATISSVIIQNVIREKLGFDGLLLTDDLSMRALKEPFDVRARNSLKAGCDIVLHCNGDMDEMSAVMRGMSDMSSEATTRWNKALQRRKQGCSINSVENLQELNSLLT